MHEHVVNDRGRPGLAASPPVPAGHRCTWNVPAYVEDHYWWAYLHPASLAVFDHTPVVNTILWGCYGQLKEAVLAEIEPGRRVLQAACVYGGLSPDLARKVGGSGSLDVIDVAPPQVANCRRKLGEFQHAAVRIADAASPGGGPYDVVCCFFLLHELPDYHKGMVVNGLLRSVAPGGKVIFVDYHRPHPLHPAKPITGLVFSLLEPFARRLWDCEIADFATDVESFKWRKRTYFGGLFQKVVAKNPVPAIGTGTAVRPQPERSDTPAGGARVREPSSGAER